MAKDDQPTTRNEPTAPGSDFDTPVLERTPDRDGDATGQAIGAALEISWPGLAAMAEHQRFKEILRGQLFSADNRPITIGRFTVDRELGSGGMGVVYAARDDELKRAVAIKLLRGAAGNSDIARARLKREARAMAQLSHPNVAQVHEVGEHEGEVFIAMELVDGTTLRHWQSDDAEDWRQILAMYVQAGRGLAAAHEQGIVHRDFKPDNVLVGADGRARVVDFGLAHAQSPDDRQGDPGDHGDHGDPDGTPAPGDSESDVLSDPITRSDAFLGTVAYMSPEQFAGEPTHSRSDQFSFCIALYEALHGVRPFAGDDVVAVAENVLAGAIDRPPAGVKLPVWLRRALLRGLAVTPDERFPSMDALLAVLDRDGRKKRIIAVAAATLVLGVGAGLAVGVPLASPDTAPPCAAAGSEITALWSPEIAARIGQDFARSARNDRPYATTVWRSVVRELDAYAASWAAARRGACRATRVEHSRSEELFDRQMICLERRRIEFAAWIDQLDGASDAVIERAVQGSAALPGVASCNDLALLKLGFEPPRDDAMASRVRVVRRGVARAAALRRAGEQHGCVAAAETAAAEARTSDYQPVLAEALFELGTCQGHLGRGDQAVETLLEAVDVAETSRHDEIAARAWQQLVTTAASRIKVARRGHEWFRRARAAIHRLGRDSAQYEPLWATALDRLGQVFQLERSWKEAEARHREALEIRARVFGPDHLEVAQSLDNLANALASAGQRDDEALALYTRSRDIYRRALGEQHPKVARVDFNLAMLHLDLGHYDDARTFFLRALAGYRRAYGQDSPRTAKVELDLARLDEREGHHDRALERLDRARPALETLAVTHPDRTLLDDVHGLLHYRQQRYDDALAIYSGRLSGLERMSDAPALHLVVTRGNVAEALVALDRSRDALSHCDRALDALGPEIAPNNVFHSFILKVRGKALLALGRTQQAVEHLERSLAIRLARPGNKPELADTRWTLARALARRGQKKRPRALASDALVFYRSLGEAGSAGVREIERWLAGL